MTDLLDHGARRPRPPRATGSRRWSPTSTRTAGARRPRPPGWDVATQVAHLAWTDEVARSRPPPTRRPGTRSCCAAIDDPDGLRRRAALAGGAAPPAELLARWRDGRGRRSPSALRALPGRREDAVVRPADVADLDGDRAVHGDLGARPRRRTRRSASSPEPTDRIRHVAHLGVRTRDFAFAVHGLEPPAEEFRVELAAPDGDAVVVGPRGRRADGDRVGRTTSACWSPSGSTAPTPTWSPPGRDADRWLDIAQAFAGPPGRRTGGRRDDRASCAIGNCSGFYGDRLSAMREMLEGGAARRPHRRLPRRADHADPRPGHDEGPVARLRPDLRPPGRGLPRPRPRARRADRQPTPAGSTRPASPTGSARSPAGSGLDPAIAHVEGDDLRPLGLWDGRAHRQRLPRRLRHRRRPARPAPTSSSPAGSPTPRSSSGPAVAHHGWTPDAVRRAGRRRRRRPRPRVRHPGHRRQLLRLPRRCPTRGRPLGFPLAEIAADGSQRDHQARRHRRRGHRRHRHRPAGLRDPVDPLPRPRRHHPPRLDRSSRQDGPDRVAITGVRGEAPPEQLKVCVNELGGFRNTVEFVLTGLDIEAKAAWVRAQLDRGARRPPPQRSTWSRGRPARPPDADTEEGASRLLRCTVKDPDAGPGRQAVHRRGGRARARVVPRLHADRAARPAHAVRRLPRRRTSTARAVAHTVVHADGTPRGGRRPADGRRSPARPTPAPGPRRTPRPPDVADPPDAARHVRARPLRRQGRRRQPRAVGRPRRLRARTTARVTWLTQADHPAAGPRAGARGGRPRRRGLPAAQPRRRQRLIHGLLGEASPRRPGSTRRPRGSASGSGRGIVVDRGGARCDVAGPTSERRCERAGARVRAPRGRAAPPGVGGRRRGAARAAPAAGEQGLLGVAFPEEVGGEGGDLLDTRRAAGGDASRPARPAG